ncbi:uncharacterized protein I303_106423 [Kwoniella dejecticola CBS 10117]|uniref:Translation initiation factor 4E n=1 Tax=Kwoniella dejecticola CBS 10117 TaxID=1296121 RepID=A0A1A5ZUR6_9TREE|nr:uncharacterized protein I303_08318 [Kwoniella dejecticola CBS 10117]OBR81548.1 hypothetical protein I303_08318 [Kwoniella dejecticola CBS 10117]
MPDSTVPLSAGPPANAASSSIEDTGARSAEKRGLMLPPPIPSKEGKMDGNAAAGVPGPPPRMTRLPSLKQLSDHLHYTPSSSSTAQFPNPLTTPGQSPSSIPGTPPSLRIATGSLPQGTPGGGGVAQSPLVAPSPSSRLRLPASAMMRSLSSGSNGGGTPLETVHSPNWVSRGLSGNGDLFGSSSTAQESPISTAALGTPQSSTIVPGVLPGRESAPPMSRSSSTNSYIQGYSSVPSLDQIRRRISVSQGSNNKADPILPTPAGGLVNSPAPADKTVEQVAAAAAPSAPLNIVKTGVQGQGQGESPPQSASLTASSSSSAESELTNGKKKKEHPLRHAWTLFFDSKTYKPDPSILAQKETGKALTEYEMTLLTVGKFDTVEGFARHLNNIRLPSLLNKNSNYHMFKNGIRPMWEDPSNANGGKWVILFRNSSNTMDVAWANLTMALVGEMLDEEDEVCGIVASNRPKIDRIQIWTRSRDDHDKLNKLGRRVLEVMGLEGKDRECMSMEYQYNATNSHPPSGLFLHIPFPTSRTPLMTSGPGSGSTPNRLSTMGPPPTIGLGISASTSRQNLNTPSSSGKSPTNPTFSGNISSNSNGMLDPHSHSGANSNALAQRRLSGGGMGGAANAFAGPMGGMGIPMGRIGSSGGGGVVGGMISRGSSPALSVSPSPSPVPAPRALKG